MPLCSWRRSASVAGPLHQACRSGNHAPLGKPATHALTIGIDPLRCGIPENRLVRPSPVRGLVHGKGGLGRRGPMPPRSHGPHSYVFQLFALDHQLELPDGFTLTDVVHTMTRGVIGRARLDGTYEVR